jgi:hypothetical protein
MSRKSQGRAAPAAGYRSPVLDGDDLAYVGIWRLQAAYADAVSRRAWPDLESLFRPDAPIRVDTVTGDPIDAVGAAGIVSVAGNVAPEPMRQLTDHARAGRMAEAEKIHRRLLPLFKALFIESNPGPVKFLLSAMGLGAALLRLPLVPVEPATEKIVLEAAKAVGLSLAAPTAVRA